MRLRNRKGWRTGRTAGDARRTGGTKRKAGNKHGIAGREAKSGMDLGSHFISEFRARRIRTQITLVWMGE